MGTTIGVIVPTYRRPDHLRRCLAALLEQERVPDEILAVARPDDVGSVEVIEGFSAPVRLVPVTEPGLLAAMTAGACASAAEIVAFTDDDAEPGPRWVGQLLQGFGDPSVGGVGGRDLIAGEAPDASLPVGCVTRWGKLIGNHSRGAGPARDVDVLKGVNMAYRRKALALPTGFRGRTTQAHGEVAIGLWARAQGWTLRYDPAIAVLHHEAARSASVSRERWRPDAAGEAAYNLVAGMLAAQPERFWRRALYGVLVGDRGTPGLLRAVASLLQRRPHEAAAVAASVRAQLDALRDARAGCGAAMQPLLDLQASATTS